VRLCAPADYTRGLALYRIKRGYHMLCSHAGTLLLAPAAATVLVRSGHRCLPPAPPKGLLLPRTALFATQWPPWYTRLSRGAGQALFNLIRVPDPGLTPCVGAPIAITFWT